MSLNIYTQADWNAIVPLFAVGITALVVLFADLLIPRGAKRYISIGIAIIGLVVSGVLAARGYGHDYDAFNGGFVLGGFAVVFEEIIIISTLFSLVMYGAIGREDRVSGSVALMLWSATGAMLMAGAANLMTIFLGLELLSLALYCLCGMATRPSSRESALKYLILSSTASGFMLYGMALLFGASGSVTLASFAAPALAASPLFWLGSGLFLVGIAFKLSLVPFHVWTPDVYEGAPLPVTAFMSVVTKAGTLAVFARFAYAALPQGAAHALLLPIWIVAGISMIAGNLGMLAQTDMKRLLAYSGIAQIGYIVAALAGGTPLGMRYAIFYLAAYMFMNLGAFAVVALCSSDSEEGSALASFRGLGRRRPVLAAAMTFFLLALAGFPPTAGFLGKILILSTNVGAGYGWLAALLIAGTAISLYAYFKIIRAMYAREETRFKEVRANSPLTWISLAICLIGVIAMTFYPLTPSNVLPLVK
ncbi:MAG: NADH-quinone oxidoreductase subunit N [Candidatus Eremiobacteraeota bacterium]|nr:NADH-quinone oxidoreductase subunit N [Candidatus Eremiobacteraeota bacterium]